MSNVFNTAQILTNEVVRIAHNSSAFLGRMNSDYEQNWKGKLAPGQTVYARRQHQFTVRSGSVANVQDLTDSSVPIVLQPELGIDFAVQEYDLVSSIQSNGEVNPTFQKRFIEPAGKRLAAEVDYRVAVLIKNATANFVGTPGTGPANITDLLSAKVPAQNEGVPKDTMYMAMSPTANAASVAGLATLFNNQQQIGSQYKSGIMATGLGLDFIMSQNVPSHTVGALGGTPVVNGANQGIINAGATDNPFALTTSLVTNGWTAAVATRLKAGDVITLGINQVNPETKADTGLLRTFTLTADAASDGAGNATLIIAPAIIAGGAYQNVTARPTNGVAVTVKTGTAGTTYAQNMLWHPDAITFVSPEMELPKGMDYAGQSSMAEDGGISLRFLRGFDIINNRRISRFDVLWGAAVVKPEWCVRRTS